MPCTPAFKEGTLWTTKVESELSTPRQLWMSVDALLGMGRAPGTTSLTDDDFHKFFDDKVAGVPASTEDAAPAQPSAVPDAHTLTAFDSVSPNEATVDVKVLPNSACQIQCSHVY